MKLAEILRGVLQEKCLSSYPFWYSSQQKFNATRSSFPPVPGVGQVISGNFETETDSYFLVTSISYIFTVAIDNVASNFQYTGAGSGLTQLQPAKSQSTMTLANLKNNTQYFQGTTKIIDVCSDQNQPNNLFEYIYLEPGDRLQWTVLNQDVSQIVNGHTIGIMFFLFAGIRFYMP